MEIEELENSLPAVRHDEETEEYEEGRRAVLYPPPHIPSGSEWVRADPLGMVGVPVNSDSFQVVKKKN